MTDTSVCMSRLQEGAVNNTRLTISAIDLNINDNQYPNHLHHKHFTTITISSSHLLLMIPFFSADRCGRFVHFKTSLYPKLLRLFAKQTSLNRGYFPDMKIYTVREQSTGGHKRNERVLCFSLKCPPPFHLGPLYCHFD